MYNDNEFTFKNSKLITDVTIEPLTLTEIKNHLKLYSSTYVEDITTEQILKPDSYSVGTENGTSIDVLNKLALINVNSGQNGSSGTVDITIQESDDNITFFDWYSFTQITESNDNQIHEKQYTGTKQYIRVVAVIGVATCFFSVDCVVNSYMTDEDDMLNIYLSAARRFGEDYTKMAFAPQTWEMYLNEFPNVDYINWFKSPLTSIVSVTVKDVNGDSTVLTENTHYIVDTDTLQGKIFLPYGESWYDYSEFPYNSVIIKGVCGYTGTAPYIMPVTFKQALLLHIGYMYKFRDTEIPEMYFKTIYNLYNLNRFDWF